MKNKKRITVIPDGGLGNRMRVLASCINIAQKEDRRMLVVWNKNSSLGCEMNDIFDSIGMEYQAPTKFQRFLLTKVYRYGSIKRFYKFYKLLSKVFYGNSIFDGDILDYKSNRLKATSAHNQDSSLLVATCLAFGSQTEKSELTEYWKNEENRETFKLFQFTDELRNEVDRRYKAIGAEYIGVHIRRTDHVDLIQSSPLDNYIREIDRCIRINPAQKFFLATDDADIKALFVKKYNGSIVSFDMKLARDNSEGMQGAIIELLMLSRSSKMICSVLSSHSTTAILIGNIKEITYV